MTSVSDVSCGVMKLEISARGFGLGGSARAGGSGPSLAAAAASTAWLLRRLRRRHGRMTDFPPAHGLAADSTKLYEGHGPVNVI